MPLVAPRYRAWSPGALTISQEWDGTVAKLWQTLSLSLSLSLSAFVMPLSLSQHNQQPPATEPLQPPSPLHSRYRTAQPKPGPLTFWPNAPAPPISPSVGPQSFFILLLGCDSSYGRGPAVGRGQ